MKNKNTINIDLEKYMNETTLKTILKLPLGLYAIYISRPDKPYYYDDIIAGCPVNGCKGVLREVSKKGVVCSSKKCKFKTTLKKIFGNELAENLESVK